MVKRAFDEVVAGRQGRFKPVLGKDLNTVNINTDTQGADKHTDIEPSLVKAFITEFNGDSKIIRDILEKEWHKFSQLSDLSPIFDTPFKMIYSKGPNIRDYLECAVSIEDEPFYYFCLLISGVFLHQITADCLYMREGQKLVFLQTTLYNKERQVYFDSRIGKFIGITEFGKIEAEYWNNDTAYLEKMRAAIMIFCKHNFDLLNNTIMDRKVIPVVTMQPLRSVIEKHPNLLMCEASGFYPQSIRVTMLKNGEEVTRDISSSGLISNGDWTYQITLLMEFIPKKEDVYGCKVEHSSLNEPMIVEWSK
ncbi:H-2 class II histocompatibility antigen, E-S beta chain-like [Protopterus annectens]|uniref:H-2 class II histocompatibility antigen, E-S beta chain-like n=1 Tax=Protopterus annectens TaxID=7888 RepID=UPI001CFC3202|nr:H-2 class II histocompatibility antigen, E-S beta chain-like [Protopterus annectens]